MMRIKTCLLKPSHLHARAGTYGYTYIRRIAVALPLCMLNQLVGINARTHKYTRIRTHTHTHARDSQSYTHSHNTRSSRLNVVAATRRMMLASRQNAEPSIIIPNPLCPPHKRARKSSGWMCEYEQRQREMERKRTAAHGNEAMLRRKARACVFAMHRILWRTAVYIRLRFAYGKCVELHTYEIYYIRTIYCI